MQTVQSQHPIRSDQTQLNAIHQSGPVESDRANNHSESGAVITLTSRLESTENLKKKSELLMPVGLSLGRIGS